MQPIYEIRALSAIASAKRYRKPHRTPGASVLELAEVVVGAEHLEVGLVPSHLCEALAEFLQVVVLRLLAVLAGGLALLVAVAEEVGLLQRRGVDLAGLDLLDDVGLALCVAPVPEVEVVALEPEQRLLTEFLSGGVALAQDGRIVLQLRWRLYL